MSRYIASVIALALTAILFTSLRWTDQDYSWEADESVAAVLEALGEKPNAKPDFSVDGVSAEAGKELVLYGITKGPNGRKVSKQSKHFVCTTCHNIQREDPDLSVVDPQARLEYVHEKGMPFLQGTALYGVVNRTKFYNGDYEKKYGDLVKPARNNIREAIQLCAVECSQGRELNEWEMESVLAYLWTIDLKMNDLLINEEDAKKVDAALNGKGNKKEAVKLVKSYYLQASPATFVRPPDNRRTGFEEITGNPENGKLIYESSCLHCHKNGEYAFFKLDESRFSLDYLEKHIPRYTRYSLYQVSRWGTSPMAGKETYMPNYTLEKMSNQQLEDLRAYIELSDN
ncbi:MAG: cytochrome c [Saprospiraceae bacterium]|nr:cytochrome c [Saprospiraceae bacterium]